MYASLQHRRLQLGLMEHQSHSKEPSHLLKWMDAHVQVRTFAKPCSKESSVLFIRVRYLF